MSHDDENDKKQRPDLNGDTYGAEVQRLIDERMDAAIQRYRDDGRPIVPRVYRVDPTKIGIYGQIYGQVGFGSTQEPTPDTTSDVQMQHSVVADIPAITGEKATLTFTGVDGKQHTVEAENFTLTHRISLLESLRFLSFGSEQAQGTLVAPTEFSCWNGLSAEEYNERQRAKVDAETAAWHATQDAWIARILTTLGFPSDWQITDPQRAEMYTLLDEVYDAESDEDD